MKILIVHRYYWPDAGAYAAMLHIMAQKFVEEGHEVTVFSTQPGYNNVTDERLPRRQINNGIEEIRVGLFKENKKKFWNRAINVALFVTQLIFHCLFRFRRYDLMTVASFPPTVTAMVIRWLAWINGSKYLYHCQDIYPEIAQTTGLIKRKWLSDLALNIDRRTCKRATAIVALSGDMVKTLTDRGVPDTNMHIINNFIIDKFDPSVTVDESLQKTPGKFRVLFAGNMGRFQNLDQLMAAANLLKSNEEIQFFFVGAGAMENELKQQATDLELMDKTVFFRPFQPLEKIMRVIHDADLAIVSLSPGVIDCAYPSKTMSYVEAGCRILALLEPSSEIAQLIVDKDLGAVCQDSTMESVAAAIEKEFTRWKEADYDREHIRTVGNDVFGQDAILNKWVLLLKNLEDGKASGKQTEGDN